METQAVEMATTNKGGDDLEDEKEKSAVGWRRHQREAGGPARKAGSAGISSEAGIITASSGYQCAQCTLRIRRVVCSSLE